MLPGVVPSGKSDIFSLVFNAVWVAVEMGLLTSDVLSTLPSPIIFLSIPETVPVNVGLLIGAFAFKPVL